MKIAISSSGKTLDSVLDLRFGRCDYFIIVENENVSCIENKGASCGGGAGIAAAQQIIDEKVEAVITGSVGPNALEPLLKSNINIYKSSAIPVELALEKFKKGELSEITQAGPSHHGM